MLPLLIVSLVLSGIILGLFVFYMPKIVIRSEPRLVWVRSLHELEARMERLEVKWHGTLEELQERLERGTVLYRKVRQRERYDSREAESREESEGEPADPSQEVLEFDETGSDPRGLSLMPDPVDGTPDAPWKVVARDLAQQIAGGGGP